MISLGQFKEIRPIAFESHWRSPANIAFVKYWGKKGHQIPANPSLSLTLSECYTETSLTFTPGNFSVEVIFDGKKEDKFAEKIQKYISTLVTEVPALGQLQYKVKTMNTFPHGAGIASSASGLSALALCLTDYLYFQLDQKNNSTFYQMASNLSRLASGSACRSIYGSMVSWGESELAGSSDEFATPFDVHPEFQNLQDTILVISAAEKNVSSRAGHDRMKEHPFAEARFIQAKNNYSTMLKALAVGDLEVVGNLLEVEALTLHAMMMTSPDSYTLLKPNSLVAIDLVRDFRKQTGIPVYFTFDAGPNLHLIYPAQYKEKITVFASHELAPICSKIIYDECGKGPVRC
ncbi:MAG: diphosphomevalonate decarboxylase [Bacteriovoracaceae bacterium]